MSYHLAGLLAKVPSSPPAVKTAISPSLWAKYRFIRKAVTDVLCQDIRHANVITLSTPLDPIRSLCFAPRNSSAPSYHLVAAAESGHISRWDLRQPKVPIDRTIAHSGGALTLDWKASVSNYSAFAGESGLGDERRPAEDGWGWLATAGMDGTVKIWDMSASNGSMRQVHTLNVARPVSFVRWHASAERPCDVVVTPLSASSTPGQSEKSWQPDIEIWDVRREYLAKETLWTGGALVCGCHLSTDVTNI